MAENQDRTPNVEDLKQVEYYATQANAWINTRMERDKSLLTLSAGGVGVLVTLLTTKGVESVYALSLYVLAILSFIVCMGSLIAIFTLNSGYIEKVIQGSVERSRNLRVLDHVALSSFAIGIVISLVIGLSTGIESIQSKREVSMSKEKLEKAVMPVDMKRSLDGISAIAPRPQQPQNATQETSSTGSQSFETDSSKK